MRTPPYGAAYRVDRASVNTRAGAFGPVDGLELQITATPGRFARVEYDTDKITIHLAEDDC